MLQFHISGERSIVINHHNLLSCSLIFYGSDSDSKQQTHHPTIPPSPTSITATFATYTISVDASALSLLLASVLLISDHVTPWHCLKLSPWPSVVSGSATHPSHVSVPSPVSVADLVPVPVSVSDPISTQSLTPSLPWVLTLALLSCQSVLPVLTPCQFYPRVCDFHWPYPCCKLWPV